MSASATAHQRSISTFVDEYSGVVGLYSHLAQCWRHQPPFLRRNLACRRDTYEGERLELNGHKKIEPAGDNAATSRQERGGKGGSSGASSAQAGKSRKSSSDAKELMTGRKSVHTGKGMVIYRFRFNEGLQEWLVEPHILCSSQTYLGISPDDERPMVLPWSSGRPHVSVCARI